MRGVGALEALRAGLPDAVVAAAAVLTHLGDPAVLLAIAVVAYWRARPDAARLLAAALAAVGLVLALKALFALPRPPPALRTVPADGYGFPSGHATGAATVYGGLALAVERFSPRTRLAAAALAVAAVALSRVVIGVHYLVDVVAGVLVGTALLLVVWGLSRRRVAPAFWLAAALGGAAAVLDGTPDAALGFGTAAGAALAWAAVGDADLPAVSVPATAAAAAGIVVVVGGPWLLAAGAPVLWASGTLAGAAIVALPAVTPPGRTALPSTW